METIWIRRADEMNLDDILYTGSRPTTLRIVLGLMEDAENSLETYRWAVPALMHSYDTEDKELFDYIQEVFKRKELSPYKPYNKKEKPETSDEKLIRKMVMNEHVMRGLCSVCLSTTKLAMYARIDIKSLLSL